jgi:hypothetical protein
MYWETLPSWFWVIYYSFLLITLSASIFSVITKRNVIFSIINIVFVVTVPITALLNSIGRVEGINEVEHLIGQLQQGEIWSIYVLIGYLFIVIWWLVFFLWKKVKSNDHYKTNGDR